MAGYSGTPLTRKLGITAGSRVGLFEAPEGFSDTLGPLPDGARIATTLSGRFDVVLAFFTQRHRLERRLGALRRAVEPAGGLWIAWPKRTSGVPTDITEDTIREIALPTGLVDNKVCAIDGTWSGLRLVVRRELR